MIGPSNALRAFITQAPPHDQFIDVLELRHPGWSQPYVLINYFQIQRVTFEDGRSLDAQPIGFNVDLPGAGTKGRQDMSVAIDNVSSVIWDALEIAQAQPQQPITVVWRGFLRSNFTTPCAVPITLYAYQVTATPTVVTLSAQRSDAINNHWPTVVYRSERWPGLVR